MLPGQEGKVEMRDLVVQSIGMCRRWNIMCRRWSVRAGIRAGASDVLDIVCLLHHLLQHGCHLEPTNYEAVVSKCAVKTITPVSRMFGSFLSPLYCLLSRQIILVNRSIPLMRRRYDADNGVRLVVVDSVCVLGG